MCTEQTLLAICIDSVLFCLGSLELRELYVLHDDIFRLQFSHRMKYMELITKICFSIICITLVWTPVNGVHEESVHL